LLETGKSNPATDSATEDIIIEFTREGGLIYSIVERGRIQKIFLRYYIEGDELVTDQLSAPRTERTRFKLDGSKMILQYSDRVEVYEEIERERADKIVRHLYT
jgi:hypothetical protein